jgi:hypothetical protein
VSLLELDPHWTVIDETRRGMGVSFECPTHRNHRLAVGFTNPIDGGPPFEKNALWVRTGESFATLTLVPSIDASETIWGNPGTPCWHGHITSGEVT